MANIPKTGIVNASTIQAEHLTRIIDSLDGTGSYDINATGSFSGSFAGDGTNITGVTAEWDGTHVGNAEITGSLIVTGGVSGSFSGSFEGDGSQLINVPNLAGIFGISDATGNYTYYATLTLAMASAVSGEVIEMFADVVETGAVTVTLKDGVNINGNGHTYTLNNATSIHALVTANSVTTSCDILNLIVIRTGAVGTTPADNCALFFGINTTGTNNLSGSTFENTGGGVAITFTSNSRNDVSYAVARATGSYGAIYVGTPYARLSHCTGYSTIGTGIYGGNLQSCVGISDSGIGINGGTLGSAENCTGISSTNYGFYASAKVLNCIGRSTSSDGFNLTNAALVVGCIGISVSGAGFRQQNMKSYNCTGISSSNYGYFMAASAIAAYGVTSRSTSNASILTGTANQVYNGLIISDWNNVAGYGIYGTSNVAGVILNCTFILSNASAPYLYIFTNAAQAISTRGNTYKGGGAFNVNITQAIVTTEDSQGNIFL